MNRILRPLLAILFALLACQAFARYPDRPVKVLVGYAPGGPTDVSARLMAHALTKALGQSFVVENRPGAGGLVADQLAANAKPDGYTLLVASTGPATITPVLHKDIHFDALARLEPVVMFAQTPGILLVRNTLPVKSVKQLIALSRKEPGKLNMASAGVGSLQQLVGRVFQDKEGIKWTHIPFKGSAPMLNAMMADRVDVMIDLVASSAPFVQAGKVRALAVTTEKRSGKLRNVPTLAELGYPGFNYSGWQSLVAPKGTPRAIVAKLNAAINAALKTPALSNLLKKHGSDPIGGSPAYLGKIMRDQTHEWARIIKAAHISVSH